ncbi:hypothetical protein [Nocardia sp. NPDC050406]|uniref:hypothetical protein n=1 Tax=Nocardia sp. NPDC050406 TaxID=3364318 RepID=UPI0037AF0E31
MTTIDTRPQELVWLDDRLLTLDPDLETLFAEVDDILCEAEARSTHPHRGRAHAPRPAGGGTVTRTVEPPRLRGRPPRPVPPTQRAPPGR